MTTVSVGAKRLIGCIRLFRCADVCIITQRCVSRYRFDKSIFSPAGKLQSLLLIARHHSNVGTRVKRVLFEDNDSGVVVRQLRIVYGLSLFLRPRSAPTERLCGRIEGGEAPATTADSSCVSLLGASYGLLKSNCGYAGVIWRVTSLKLA